MEAKLTPEQDALSQKLYTIFSDAELLRGIATPVAHQTAIVKHLVFKNHYTMAQAEVAHEYILNKDFSEWRPSKCLEKQDFYPTKTELQAMQQSGDIFFCRRSHQEQILKEVYKSAKLDAGAQEYERGKRDGIKQACEATPELKALYKSEAQERLATMKEWNDSLQLALDEALDYNNEQQSTIKSLFKQIESLRNALGALASHTETYFSDKATTEERSNAKEEVQNDIAKAHRLLRGDEPRRTTAIPPVNEETGAFDNVSSENTLTVAEKDPIAVLQALLNEQKHDEAQGKTPAPMLIGPILSTMAQQADEAAKQGQSSRTQQNRQARQFAREAA